MIRNTNRFVIILVLVLVAAASYAEESRWWGLSNPMHRYGPWNYVPPGNPIPISVNDAIKEVEHYNEWWKGENLAPAEIMEFSYHYYIEVVEKDSGIGAFEVLVNKYTGDLTPEPGPNMMWNTKYSGMGYSMMGKSMMGPGMMGSSRQGMMNDNRSNMGPDYEDRELVDDMPITGEEAIDLAQRYLDIRIKGSVADEHAAQFFGYYTIHVLDNEETVGMLSVNGYSGDVWFHDWHGDFESMKELEDHGKDKK